MPKHLLTRTVPGLLLAFALLFTAPSIASDWWLGEASSSTAGVTTINLTGSSTPCTDLQTALDRFNVNDEDVRLRVSGIATITDEDAAGVVDRGGHSTCAYIASLTEDKSFSTGGGSLDIFWDGAGIVYSDATQTQDLFLLQVGDTHDMTSSTYTTAGMVGYVVSMHGTFYCRTTVDNDGTWVQGDIPAVPWGTNSDGTVFGCLFLSGATNLDFSNMTWEFFGLAADQSDIGIYQSYSFGTAMGTPIIRNFGVGYYSASLNNASVVGESYIQQNDVNVVLGDSQDSNRLTFQDGSTASLNSGGITFSGGVIEGASYNDLVIFEQSAFTPATFDNIYIEPGVSDNDHSIIIGAGRCSVTTTNICGLDSDCPAETCVLVSPSTDPIRSVNFNGGRLPFYQAGASNWETFVMGPGAITSGGVHRNRVMLNGVAIHHVNGETKVGYDGSAVVPLVFDWLETIFEMDTPLEYPYTVMGTGEALSVSSSTTLEYQDLKNATKVTKTGASAVVTTLLASPAKHMKDILLCDLGSAGSWQVSPGAGDTIYMNGTALTADENIVSAGYGTCVTIWPVDASTWIVTNNAGAWTEETP